MKQSKIYIALTLLLLVAFAFVFICLPRPKVSPLEKRELAHFPTFTLRKLWAGTFTDSINTWFSDTQPHRDQFMAFAMAVKQLGTLKAGGDDNITFHATTEAMPGGEMGAPRQPKKKKPSEAETDSLHEYENTVTADEKAKVANAGIIIVGKGANVRALMAYGGGREGGTGYAQACNAYKKAFPQCRVYCMVIPSAAAYYLPEKAKDCSRSQLPTLQNIEARLDTGVTFVNIYNVLGQHARENIYLRTDHHWAPLGAYYAARQLAREARVPFRSIGDTAMYERHVVHGFVGTMYAYSKDISVKQAPEDFVYWTPRRATYTTTYITYTIDEHYQVVGEHRPVQGTFFFRYRDGASGAYCTFMGGDTKITQVRTDAPNHRRLLILKDSYGNALPGYLFYSFEEIHVVDGRYFTRNMRTYVEENQITDIVFCNNVFEAYGSKYKAYLQFLDMEDGTRSNASTQQFIHTKRKRK